MTTATAIKVEVEVSTSLDRTWELFTDPKHIVNWYFANDDWHAPSATNDLQEGGKFLIRMESKDRQFGFDFEGIYDDVNVDDSFMYTLGDGRKVRVTFEAAGKGTKVTEIFEPESVNPLDLQHTGWQAILDNFKKYAESL